MAKKATIKSKHSAARRSLRDVVSPESRGWLVEKGPAHHPRYLTVTDRHFDWTYDHEKALRFSRSIDCRRLLKFFLLGHYQVDRIAEHGWGANRKITLPQLAERVIWR